MVLKNPLNLYPNEEWCFFWDKAIVLDRIMVERRKVA